MTGLESAMTLNWIGVHYDFKLNSNCPNTWNDNRTECLWLYDDKLRVCHDFKLSTTTVDKHMGISLDFMEWYLLVWTEGECEEFWQSSLNLLMDSLLLIYLDSNWLFGSIKHNQFDKLLGME